MMMQSWSDVLGSSLQTLWLGFANFLPSILGAVVVLVIGLVVAAGLGALVEKVLDVVKLDTFLKKLGLGASFERAGLQLRAAYFFGRLIYWFVIMAFLLAVTDSLGLYALSEFLTNILNYLPNVLAAVLIMLASVVLAAFLRKVVSASVRSAKLHGANFLASLAWWSVVIFGFLAALIQLNIAPSVIQSIVTGFIAMLALAGGLAFGLGGRDYAAYLVGKLREHHNEPR